MYKQVTSEKLWKDSDFFYPKVEWGLLSGGSLNWVINGSSNGLLPVRHQAITWTIAVFFNWTPRNKF